MDQITYRTSDNTRWGIGQGSDLSATQVDINFWYLYTLITLLDEQINHNGGLNGIASFSVSGNSLYVTMNSGLVFGPYTLPTSSWNPRGLWQSSTPYAVNDVIYDGNAVYLVIFAHTSGTTFSPTANDGSGHFYYKLIFQDAQQTRNFALYAQGSVQANEVLQQYITTDAFTLPYGLTGSQAVQGVATTTNVSYSIAKNGTVIGSVDFTPTSVSFTFTAQVSFAIGDILSIIAPAVPDNTQANVSITLQAILS